MLTRKEQHTVHSSTAVGVPELQEKKEMTSEMRVHPFSGPIIACKIEG